MNVSINDFNIVGISTRTTNENQQAAKDIPKLWEKFFSNNIASKIPNRTDNNIYCVYTEYEEDFTKPYTVLIGCKVESLSSIPDEMIGKSFDGGKYKNFTTEKGKLSEVVIGKWMEIWETDLPRKYTADFELY